jgi:single-stranded DNA-binding protein
LSAKVLVSGTLFQAPEKRAVKRGRFCVTATLIAKDGDHTRLWPIVAFNETVQAELMRLSGGDAVAVQGSLRAELYDKAGETQLAFGVVAEHARGLRRADRKRKNGDATSALGTESWRPPFVQ